MAEEKAPFRFLTDTEFWALAVRDRAIYLVAASQELEEKQKALRALLRQHINDTTPKKT